jgi:hypothetical protein
MMGSEFQTLYRYIQTLVQRIEKLERQMDRLADADELTVALREDLVCIKYKVVEDETE